VQTVPKSRDARLLDRADHGGQIPNQHRLWLGVAFQDLLGCHIGCESQDIKAAGGLFGIGNLGAQWPLFSVGEDPFALAQDRPAGENTFEHIALGVKAHGRYV